MKLPLVEGRSGVGHRGVNSCTRRPPLSTLTPQFNNSTLSSRTSFSPRPSVRYYWLKSHVSMINPTPQHTGSAPSSILYIPYPIYTPIHVLSVSTE
ncbi:hypothetical protein ACSQ67_021224 [Phaseolus vulgaris]